MTTSRPAVGALSDAPSEARTPTQSRAAGSVSRRGRRSTALGESLYLSVIQLLGYPQLAGARLLTSLKRAKKRRIRTASVQELPLQDFVREHELVMTTGIGLSDAASVTEFISAVARAGASALAIAVGPHISGVPDTAVTQADALGLPLIELPWELRFSEVSEIVFGYSLDLQNRLIRQSEETQELFTRIVLRGDDTPHLCRSVEQLLGRAVRIEDLWGEWEDGGPGSLAATAGDDWERTSSAFPIIAAGRRLGTLYVAPGPERLSELELRIAHHAATAAALIMLLHRAAAEGEVRGRGEILVELLKLSTEPTADVARRVRAVGLDPDRPVGLVVLSFDAGAASWTADIEATVRWAVDRVLGSLPVATLHSWQQSDVTVLLDLGDGGSGSWAGRMVRELNRVLVPLTRLDVAAGIGPDSVPLADLSTAHREATTAARLGRIAAGARPVTAYADLGMYPALYQAHQGAERSALEKFETRYLGPLLRYEAGTKLPLIDTLVAFFAANGNVSATARRLRINRQTLMYRLDRIKALTGLAATEPYGRFALELALRGWAVREGTQLDLPNEPEGGQEES
jgi:purine catabolism regulator